MITFLLKNKWFPCFIGILNLVLSALYVWILFQFFNATESGNILQILPLTIFTTYYYTLFATVQKEINPNFKQFGVKDKKISVRIYTLSCLFVGPLIDSVQLKKDLIKIEKLRAGNENPE